MKLSLLATLLSIVYLHNASASSQRYSHGGFHQHQSDDNKHYIKRNIDDSSYKFDGEEPKDNKVKQALDQLYDAMSDDSIQKDRIDPKVVKFLRKKSTKEPRELPPPLDFVDKNCSVMKKNMHLRKYDVGARFAVNAMNFNQTIELSVCVHHGITCGDKSSTPVGMTSKCEQVYRELKILTLPTAKEEYNVNDFEITKFPVPSGCQCVLSRNDLH